MAIRNDTRLYTYSPTMMDYRDIVLCEGGEEVEIHRHAIHTEVDGVTTFEIIRENRSTHIRHSVLEAYSALGKRRPVAPEVTAAYAYRTKKAEGDVRVPISPPIFPRNTRLKPSSTASKEEWGLYWKESKEQLDRYYKGYAKYSSDLIREALVLHHAHTGKDATQALYGTYRTLQFTTNIAVGGDMDGGAYLTHRVISSLDTITKVLDTELVGYLRIIQPMTLQMLPNTVLQEYSVVVDALEHGRTAARKLVTALSGLLTVSCESGLPMSSDTYIKRVVKAGIMLALEEIDALKVKKSFIPKKSPLHLKDMIRCK